MAIRSREQVLDMTLLGATGHSYIEIQPSQPRSQGGIIGILENVNESFMTNFRRYQIKSFVKQKYENMKKTSQELRMLSSVTFN